MRSEGERVDSRKGAVLADGSVLHHSNATALLLDHTYKHIQEHSSTQIRRLRQQQHGA